MENNDTARLRRFLEEVAFCYPTSTHFVKRIEAALRGDWEFAFLIPEDVERKDWHEYANNEIE